MITYLFFRFFTFILQFIPYRGIHFLGKKLGSFTFYFLTSYRKRVFSNLALAKDLHLSPSEIRFIAKKSFQNLAINMLEYPKFSTENHFDTIITCKNPEIANDIYKQGKGIIFFCGHQANWETLFLDGTLRMKGVAIGKSIKNKKIYNWIVSIREKNGGKIIDPKNALKEGLRNLRQGIFLGILGDQAMPSSNYSYPFLGRRAWTTTAPALLSHRTNSPIIVATTKREKGRYLIHYSNPIYPDLTKSIEEEIPRLMNHILSIFEESIKECPEEWFWHHNRWKQQTPKMVYKEYRHDALCIILPEQTSLFEAICPHLSTLRSIYKRDFMTLITPEKWKDSLPIKVDEVITYQKQEELFREDYRFKLIFNFSTCSKIKKHYKKLSAFDVLSLQDLEKIAYKKNPHLKDPSDVFIHALCRPNTFISGNTHA
jgi:KDO2-lipid IV(A) lauroyltransferase